MRGRGIVSGINLEVFSFLGFRGELVVVKNVVVFKEDWKVWWIVLNDLEKLSRMKN